MTLVKTEPRDTELWERCCAIGVHVGKAENMRTTAAVLTTELVDTYLKTDQGVMDCVREGVEPNLKGVFSLVVATPGYPEEIFGSFSSFKILLQIGRSPDPVAADAAEREQQKVRNERKAVTKRPVNQTECNSEENPLAETVGDHPRVKAHLAEWHAFTDEQRDYLRPLYTTPIGRF